MKIIVYSDVHGNKYALDALRDSDDYKTADRRIFLGDAVSFCAYPNECIEIIKNSGDDALIGNHDVYCAYGIPEEEYENINKKFLAHLDYIKNLTTEENKEFLRSLKHDISFEEQGKKFYFTHFIWVNDKILAKNPDGKKQPTTLTAEPFNSKVDANFVFFGHNHTAGIVEMNNKTYVCVGSLGVRSPGNYVVLDINENYVKIEPKRIEYNHKKLIEEMIEQDYPSAKVVINYFGEK